MTIYWIDFNASTQGNGTYASPYNNVGGLGNGNDEIRVKSHSIASLTDFAFTGSTVGLPSKQLQISVADASLFSLNQLVMYDATKTLFRIYEIDTTNNLIKTYDNYAFNGVYSSTNITNGSFRVIDDAMLPHSNLSQIGFATNSNSSSSLNGQNISDGWYSETQRVTDRSYMTIIAYPSTKTSGNLEFKGALGKNSIIDFQNTALCHTGTSDIVFTPHRNANLGASAHIHSITGGQYSGGIKTLLMNDSQHDGLSIEVNYIATMYGLNSTSNLVGATNADVKIHNWNQNSDYLQTSYYYATGSSGTLTLGNVWRNSNTGSRLIGRDSNNPKWSYILNGEFHHLYAVNSTQLVEDASSVTLGSNFSVKYDMVNSPKTKTTFDSVNSITRPDYPETTAILKPVTFTNNTSAYSVTNITGATVNRGEYDRQNKRLELNDIKIIYDSDDVNVTFPGERGAKGGSVLVVDTNSSNPTKSEYFFPLNGNNPLIATPDTTYYKTTAPSLKFNLATFASGSHTGFEHVKAIDIPVNGNGSTQFTVSGWVKSDAGFMDQDKFKVKLTYNTDTQITQNINISNAESGWTQFNINFTPADVQIAQLHLGMEFKAGSKSCWLSDVGVS